MYLDEGARQWLALIEELTSRADAAVSDARKLKSSAKRVTSEKGKERSAKALADNQNLQERLKQELQAETEGFFQEVFQIGRNSVVALKKADGTLSKSVVASHLNVRKLLDGTGVFSVHGASMTVDLSNGLPLHDLLTAREALGERLVSLS